MIAEATPTVEQLPAKPRCKNMARKFGTFRRDGYRCQYCGKDLLADIDTLVTATIDHFHPKGRGGDDTAGNRVSACLACNMIKGSHKVATIEEGRQLIAERRAVYTAAVVEYLKDDNRRLSEAFNPPPLSRSPEVEQVLVDAILTDYADRMLQQFHFLQVRLMGRRAIRPPLWRRILGALGV